MSPFWGPPWHFFLLPESDRFPSPSHGILLLPPSFLANLFLLISSILGSRTAGPHTQFVQWFMEECVDCLEQGGRGSILQFMPFTTVSVPPPAGPSQPPLAQSGSASLRRAQGPVASGKGLVPPDITPTTTPLSSCLSDRYQNW